MSRDRDERPSWSEIDRMRDKAPTQREREPRSPADRARAAEATRAYVKELDKLFSDTGGGEGEALAKAVHDAHGSPELAAACRTFVEALGVPRDVALLQAFLDADDPSVVVPALEALRALQRAGELAASPGLRSQLRVLAQSFDDDVAGVAEEILEAW